MTGEKKKREINKKERVNELSRTLTHKLNVSRNKTFSSLLVDISQIYKLYI